MEKVKLSIKLLSQIPQNLSRLQPPLYKSITDSLTKTTNPKPFFNTPPTKPHFSSHPSFNFSDTFSRVLGNPMSLKQILLSNPQFKDQTRRVYDHLVLMRSQFSRRSFQVSPYHSYSRGMWMPTTENAILGLIAANIAVLFLWRIVDPAFMRKHFMISVDNFTSGRLHTLLTSAFSHIELDHIFSNMIGLYFFGRSIGYQFGPGFLLKLYVAGALGGSVFYLVHHAFLSRTSKGSGPWYVDPKKIEGLGASGAVNAVMLLYIFLDPRATIYFNFLIPVPAILFGAFLIGTDLYRTTDKNSQISGSAHLGGAFVAAIAWAAIKKGMI